MTRVDDTRASTATVSTSLGTVRGSSEGGIRRFLGIPYAMPPFGERRFALPEPVTAWSEERDATAFGPTAPQHPYQGSIGELLSSVEIDGDDILTVNVWSPADADGLPVMVWFHGGALERGTPALSAYDGTTFARDGVVFVSVAYRLGSEGFSVLDDAPRNLGLADAAAGLQWVHREIAAFGGDPDRITIVGESAGGALVAALLTRPDTAPLVAAAVIESGPLIAESPGRAGRVTRAIAKRLGIPATREAFSQMPPDQLLDARRELAAGSTPLRGAPSFALALDDGSLPRSPHEALASVDVPLIIGTNTDEYRLWFPPAALERITPLTLFIARTALGISRRAVGAYKSAWPGATTGEIFGQLATDVLLRGPMVSVARARSAPTYVYEFAWPSPVRGLRAAHALEIGFVFDSLDSPDTRRMAGAHAPQALADRMHRDWVQLIRTGDPGWPAFDEAGQALRYDEETTTVPLPRGDALATLPAPRVR
ncbi:carboxylesterase/lipase family protein [Microbacterium sp. C7(2022)]|uniref:carboxylesterase/lipase family protein n=1 Tax=Microbacterium sp. C7(2022) TaxID=2992759 RepID=UPI00237A814A|nr:carboxylesterase family protein [Microbacterium sp. C7(2022)]MDE0547016.1 carboxylesterase family protein [Microbacterium sp. C7(2022)]